MIQEKGQRKQWSSNLSYLATMKVLLSLLIKVLSKLSMALPGNKTYLPTLLLNSHCSLRPLGAYLDAV